MSQRLSVETKRRLKIAGGVGVLILGLYYYQYHYRNDINKEESSCCKPKSQTSCCAMEEKEDAMQDRKKIINDRYSATARNFDKIHSKEEQEKLRAVAEVFGYSVEELAEIGKEANLGLGCGNPVKQAKLKKGEVVLDLGCGAGMDLFLARKYIGDSTDGGQLLGVDFSTDMIAKAKRNANKKKYDTSHFKFMHAEIENMKEVIPDDTVDVVISNCVLNLVPNKLNAFKEVYRVLKPNGGRICLSDIALKKELPTAIRDDIQAVVNCISGSCLKTEYEKLLLQAGFKKVQMIDKNVDLNVWKSNWTSMVDDGDKTKASGGSCCAPSEPKASSCCGGDGDDTITKTKPVMDQVIADTDLNDYVASYYVFGYK